MKQIAAYGKPVILSTGASTLAEICEAVEVIENEGNNQIALLHCVLSYPTKDVDAHLNMITHLKEVFPNYVIGYSIILYQMLNDDIKHISILRCKNH